ncbi:YqiJ family protein [Aggregatibacter kilianii]|uniref:YqiJ family protein n=1 Tax=Aggregatibacter kilianii TaxID=2025884 RepID=UPI000D65574A|nr:YqiJ family protein [Aggregatibacter kilianii]
MWELITAPQNEIFGIAIMLMLLLGILEIISFMLGGINDWVDGFLPDSLTETAHAEIGLDTADAGIFIRFLSWLYVGKLPLLMLLVIFLAIFGLFGYSLQYTWHNLSGFYLHGCFAAVIVWFVSLPLVRVTAAGVYKIFPKDETTAVEQDTLVGCVGVIVLGTAKPGSPAQARVKDGYGQQHYVMVEPDDENALTQGETVLLISLHNNLFKAIKNPNGNLVD